MIVDGVFVVGASLVSTILHRILFSPWYHGLGLPRSSSLHQNECSHRLSAGSHATRVRRRLHTSVARGGFSLNLASKRLIIPPCPAASTPPRRRYSRTSNDRQPSHRDDGCACCLGLISTAPGRLEYDRILETIYQVSLV